MARCSRARYSVDGLRHALADAGGDGHRDVDPRLDAGSAGGGAYSYPTVGGAQAARGLAAPLGDALYFAGEATVEPPANGTVEGALESGYRAAREVLGA